MKPKLNDPDAFDPAKPARVHVAEDRFLERCREALLRDLTKKYGSRKEAEAAYISDDWWIVLEGPLRSLIRPDQWRARLLRNLPATQAERSETPLRSAGELEEAVVALVKAFEFILAPWLESADCGLDLRAVAKAAGRVSGVGC
ncbi:MAG: hypothetical protein GTO22_17425 [Gemmatimonadales bacterium]|nr:hypothetical protein [Gemmatimonadales bacterium]